MDLSLIDWSRAQFALTAMFHWIFVPLTLGLGIIMCIYETIYYRTGDEKWKSLTKFWMKLFGVNFAIGVATGIILEFEFGTNWSNYSYFVGDIFGAPLAIEGIVAFFLEATFIGVMYFGWEKFSKRFHLASTWLAVIGATMSAWWILVANAWMQFPAGMDFNPETARNELTNFMEVAFSPVAVNKFCHTVTSSWVMGAAFVIAVCGWYLLKKRETEFCKRSITVASIVGIVGIVLAGYTGHGSAQYVAKHQPMKLAAMEGLYDGSTQANIVGFGVLNPNKVYNDTQDAMIVKIDAPINGLLSMMAFGDSDAYVAGINDIIKGGYPMYDGTVAVPFAQKVENGKLAQKALADFKKASKEGNEQLKAQSKAILDANMKHFGYGFIKDAKELIPPVGLTFYSFHIMVVLGSAFIGIFALILFLNYKDQLSKLKLMQLLAILSFPLAFISSQAGWMVAEVGRQPWSIQDVLPVGVSISKIPTSNVQITFFLFFAVFTILFIAECRIMLKAIKAGPAIEEGKK
ncbi:MAG: cytochrome ubiquinol oxidase subunit I [Bacteroidales bacterium]|nr:MAG: cytochrome ubiquinol oxidase subunit I [Bacteroidales bacterium]